ncbi:MAG: hypothetical protein LBC61_06925 [Candidatus Peribacteria bacterium]|nr:hypothetical protein [Candidatus Peribacteria bacterium]
MFSLLFSVASKAFLKPVKSPQVISTFIGLSFSSNGSCTFHTEVFNHLIDSFLFQYHKGAEISTKVVFIGPNLTNFQFNQTSLFPINSFFKLSTIVPSSFNSIQAILA